MTDKVIMQIMHIRKLGHYNMFDLRNIQREAYELGFFELVLFIEEHKEEYVKYILTGN